MHPIHLQCILRSVQFKTDVPVVEIVIHFDDLKVQPCSAGKCSGKFSIREFLDRPLIVR